MNQMEAVHIVQSLLPEMVQTGDAEGTLLKYAREHNLATALLEKLGQTMNVARTVQHLDEVEKSARGASFPLIDVESMINRYEEHTPLPADRMLSKLASVDANVFDRFPRPAMELEKAASAPVVVSGYHQARARRNEDELRRHELACYKEAAANSVLDFNESGEKFLVAIRQGSDFSTIERDAVDLFGPSAQPFIEKLASWTSSRLPGIRLTRHRHSKIPSLRTPRDTTGAATIVGDMIDQRDFYKAAGILCTELVKAAAKTKQDKPKASEGGGVATAEQKGVEKDLAPAMDAGAAGRPFTRIQPTPPPETSGGSKAPDPSNPAQRPSAEADKAKAEAEAKAKAEAEAKKNGKGTESPAALTLLDDSTWKEEKPDAGAPATQSLSAILQALGGSVRGGFDGGGAVLGKVEDVIGKLDGGQGKGEARHMMRAQQDAMFDAHLKRLLATDETLSQADPDRVVSLANTIRQTMPESANDINVLRSLLREGVAYDSIPLHTLSSMSDVEKSQQTSRKDRISADQAAKLR